MVAVGLTIGAGVGARAFLLLINGLVFTKIINFWLFLAHLLLDPDLKKTKKLLADAGVEVDEIDKQLKNKMNNICENNYKKFSAFFSLSAC